MINFEEFGYNHCPEREMLTGLKYLYTSQIPKTILYSIEGHLHNSQPIVYFFILNGLHLKSLSHCT